MTLLGDLKASQDVATAISTKDTLAKRPAAGVMGRFFHAEDVGALYRDSGASWELVAVVPGAGSFSSRPTAGIAGREYKASDRAGVIYRDDGTVWDGLLATLAPDTLAKRPTPAVVGRTFEATDVGVSYLDTSSAWLPIIHPSSGTLASRPGTPFVEGREFRATDMAGLLYRDNGSGWDSLLVNGGASGTLAARPAAGKPGLIYRATDNLVVYFDTGSEWVALTEEPGDLIFSARATVPGAVKCEGQALNRITFAALWKALGEGSSRWGQGDGTNTFNVPDFRERVPMGSEGGEESGAGSRGHKGGEATVKLTIAQTPSHTHLSTMYFHGVGTDGSIQNSGSGAFPLDSNGATAAEGGGEVHNNMQPYTICTIWIKT